MKPVIVAIDFDKTILDAPEDYNDQPTKLISGAKEVIKWLKDSGCYIIIWTCRTGKLLEMAKKALKYNDIPYDKINENYENLDFDTSNKIYYDILIDDKNLGIEINWNDIKIKLKNAIIQKNTDEILKIKKVVSMFKVTFKEDLAPQTILLMGLPASGKSTFINKQLTSFFAGIPHATSFSVLNSDTQLKSMQFKRSQNDFNELKGMNENDYKNKIESMSYESNNGKKINFDLSFDEFKNMDFKKFFNKMFKKYYATYFGERAQAAKNTEELSDIKIKGNDVVIVDTTGQNINRNLKFLEKSKNDGKTNTVIYLDIDKKYSIARDLYRGETEGRSVGSNVIEDIASKLPNAYKAFINSPLVDRYMKFRWDGELIKGKYSLVSDNKKYPYKKSHVDIANEIFKEAMPWLVEGDLYFEFLTPEDRKNIFMDLEKGHKVELSNGTKITNKDINSSIKIFIKRMLNVKQKHVKYKYDAKNHKYKNACVTKCVDDIFSIL